MSLKTNLQNTKAILMGAGNFPKDKELLTLENVATNIKELSRIFADKRILGLFSNNIVSLYNTPDNTKIKEELALAAEAATDTLIFYYSGHIVVRRGQMYLTTVNSSRHQVHVNAISLTELANIIRENEGATKVLIFDCAYQIADVNTVGNLQQLVKEEFSKLEENLKTAYIVASSPDTSAENFKIESPSTFTSHFVKLLETGSRKETDELTLNDIFEGISEKIKLANQLLPIRAERSQHRNRGFVNNLKFIEYKKFKTEGDTFFAKESFGEALPLYQYAAKLYNNDNDLNNKVDFINFVSEANKYFSKLNYDSARQNYQYAYQLFANQSVKNKIDTCVERMAEEFFRNEHFEKAKESYEFLVKSFPDNEVFKERLEKCEDEILLSELIDEADKLFFQDRYVEAGELYQKAMEIYPERRTIRRKEECDFLIAREKTLRERLMLEMANRQDIDIKAVVNEEVAKREQNLRKVLEVKLRVQIQQEVNKEVEKQIWQKVNHKNTADFYDFYLELFPQGNFVGEATENKQIVGEKSESVFSMEEIAENITTEMLKTEENTQIPVIQETLPINEVQPVIVASKSVVEETASEDRFGLFDDLLGDENDEVIISKPASKEDNSGEKLVFETPSFDIPAFEKPYTNGVKTASTRVEESKKVLVEEPPKQVSEEELWESAVAKNSIDGYMYYIEQTVDSAHIADAYYYISKIRNSKSQENITVIASTPMPATEVKVQSQESYEEISRIQVDTTPVVDFTYDDHDDKIWQEARSIDSVSAYYNYLNNANTKKYREDAKKRISTLNEMEKLNEQREWEHATTLDTVDAYKQYLKRYPFGNFYAKARFRITKLESELQA